MNMRTTNSPASGAITTGDQRAELVANLRELVEGLNATRIAVINRDQEPFEAAMLVFLKSLIPVVEDAADEIESLARWIAFYKRTLATIASGANTSGEAAEEKEAVVNEYDPAAVDLPRPNVSETPF